MVWYKSIFNKQNIIFFKKNNIIKNNLYKNIKKRVTYNLFFFLHKIIIKFNKNYKINNIKQQLNNNKRLGFLIFIIITSIWIISGFYTIKESDRGIVLRFGKYNGIVSSGLNWKPTFIDKIIPINVETVREQATNGIMLTSDENVIKVEMNVQYRITDPEKYLFNVINPDNSLRQALDSTVRGVIGQSAMEQVLTTNRSFIRDITQKELETAISPYKMGITILDVNFQAARPPEDVKAAFDDVIAAREEEQKTIREAYAYRNEVLPLAKGNAQKIVKEAEAYKASIILKSEGEVASFIKILPEYHLAPEITKERLYIDTMEHILSNTNKIIINDKNNNLLLLPIKELMNNNKSKILHEFTNSKKSSIKNNKTLYNSSSQINNTIRNNSIRNGR
ncbi:FtsH protease activity modulator HflK [Candidatus Providencia siddallii]|uniref:Protein HflK n=1 Tax=Candidatus Providencia siddallii TaxID=1715285 RepID=A0ABP1CGJ5_9GAMM